MRRWRAQLSIFLAAYPLYDAARWIFSSDLGQARAALIWLYRRSRPIYRALEGPRVPRRLQLRGAST